MDRALGLNLCVQVNQQMDDVSATAREQTPAYSKRPSITDFYTNRDIFITGGTGFMGKCLLEKILRSIPGQGKVYILVRPKKGKSVQERIKELSNSKVSNCTYYGIAPLLKH